MAEYSDLMAQKYQDESNFLNAFWGVPVAATIDLGTTIWNSLVPEKYEVDTGETLGNINENLFNIYHENKDTVKALSFVGGIFLPQGIALKGLSALRAGAKGATWFSQAGQTQRLAGIKTAWEQSARASSLATSLINQNRIAAVGNAFFDATMMEGVFIATMNAHPYMEDYIKDPWKNAAISIGLGTGLMGIGNLISANRAVKNVQQGVEKTSAQEILAGYPEQIPTGNTVQTLQWFDNAAKNWQNALDTKTDLTQRTKDLLTYHIEKYQASKISVIEDLLTDSAKKTATPEYKQFLAQLLTERPEQFMAGESISFAKIPELVPVTEAPKPRFFRSLIKPGEDLPLSQTGKKGVVPVSVVYQPHTGLFMTPADLKFYGTAADLPSIGTAPKNWHLLPDSDIAMGMQYTSSAHMDARYIQALRHYNQLPIEDLYKVKIAPDDLAQMQGFLVRVQRDGHLLDWSKLDVSIVGKKTEIPQIIYTPGNGYKTAKGSTYQVFDDGTTIRNKAARKDAGHEGDFGLKERSVKTVYIDSAYLGGINPAGLQAKWRIIDHGDDTLSLATLNANGQWGISPNSKNIPVSYTPALDLIPIELWGEETIYGKKAYNKIHPGNKITELFSGTRTELEQQLKAVNEQIAQKVPILDFMNHFQQAKTDMIRAYLQQGVPAEVTAIHTNVPVETVLAIGSGQEATKWMKYTDPAMILDPTQRSIVFKTTRPKLNIAQQQAVMQQQNLTDLDFLLKQSFYMQSGSKLFDGIRGYFKSEDFSLLRSLLRDKLEYITNSRLGAKFFTDSGFATRDMEEIAAIATQIGQTLTKLHTNANKQMMSMLGPDLLVVARDTASVIEHNIALKVYNSIPGKVIYDDGKFFYKDPEDATKLIQAEFEGTVFRIKTPAVKTLFDNYIALGRDFYEQEATRRSILGLPKMSDRGAWIPAYNPNNKHIAYAIDPTTQVTNVLIGKTSENLEEVISAYRHANADHHIIRHGTEQEFYNKLKSRSDPMFISSANMHMKHSGSSSAARVSSSVEELMDIVSAYDHLLNRNIKTSFELMFSDVMTKLDDMSSFTQAATKNQPLLGAKMFEKRVKDAAATVKNTLLANNEMKNAPNLWKGTNETFEYLAEKTLTTIQDIFSPLIGKQRHSWTEKHYDQVIAELQKRNIPNVFQNFPAEQAKELFHVDQTQRVTPLAPQTLVLANTAAATSLLRVGEIAHAYTNAIAYPILVTSKLSENMPKSFAGVARNTDPLTPARNIIEGFLFTHSDEGKKVLQDAANRGYITIQFSEADELFQSLRNIQGGAIAKAKEVLSSHIVDLLSKATTWSEEAVRKWAYGTGVYVAQKYYPGITDAGKRMYARQFMDQVIGNYNSAQRPTMFQGTLGMAMGLFQTYMVTMAQRLYGHLEKGEFKALTKMMLAQTGIFGAHSLPGFQQVSNMIGEHFSDKNYDLISGTYRALPSLADYIIYGIPSSLGPAIYSRGDIEPRIPNPSQGFDMIPAVNLTHQALNTMVNVAKAVPNGSQAVLEALSLQSISRPLARMSEVLNGYSITSTGQVLQKPEDVWTFTSIASRIMGARPFQDAKLRDMWHLNSMYGAMDRERRSNYTEKLRTHLRAGDIDANVVSSLAEEYMRTGTPTGWNSIVNTALAQTMLPTQSTIRNHFQPDSPHMRVLEDMW